MLLEKIGLSQLQKLFGLEVQKYHVPTQVIYIVYLYVECISLKKHIRGHREVGILLLPILTNMEYGLWEYEDIPT